MTLPVTVAYGDGIGPEIMEAVLFVLKEADAGISVETAEIGSAQYRRDWPCGIAPSSWASIQRTKVLLKAPTMTPQGKGHKSLNVALRKRLGLYANIRPVVSYHPIVPSVHPNLDIVVVRENEEDTYCGIEYQLSEDAYECTKIATNSASLKICERAFLYAKSNNRSKVTCLVKDNIMKLTDGAFRRAFLEVAAMYPEIEADCFIVDIGMAKVASQPENFDVVVTTNLFGDILSDVVALAAGSIGLAGSANIGDTYSMFEAVHGSAPDLAGKDVANPSGLLNAAVQMLVHLNRADRAVTISNALLKTLEDGIHTADIFNPQTSVRLVTTTDFARAIVNNLGSTPSQLRGLAVKLQSARCGVKTHFPAAQRRTLAGVDLTVRWGEESNKLEALAKACAEAVQQPFQLALIYAKGMELWPAAPYSWPHTDLVTLRFMSPEQTEGDVSVSQLIQGVESLGLTTAKMVKLYTFDGVEGFFTP
ncbi:isocitrate dehydrogenase [NADP] [Anaplasma platys]|uniref:Isocitrate dehydrogenase [NADP] n=1 Tax=Anaplasma platys TaxID=949 RepID=A0A858PZ68_9RICK|nr:isocitrate dehydrogenase [Anaplasma platys]QJC27901.1 isocitrate dehydrogenase [NADP] [Anaplasma platys]